jgi:hypothetical protein
LANIFCASVFGQIPICGSYVPPPSNLHTGNAHFHDRYGNTYTNSELNMASYPHAKYLQACNSGIFNLQFVVANNAPAWTNDEMGTVCAVFNYVSSQVSNGTAANAINIQIVKDPNCASIGAGTPFWDAECGISNSIVFEQILTNTSLKYPPGLISGMVCIKPTPTSSSTWHLLSNDCSSTNPCVSASQIDLYSVLLHEAMHIVGFASRIGANGSPISGNFYSRWDKFLKSTNQNASLIIPASSPTCCDNHVFNTQKFPNMPTSLTGNCGLNVFFNDGTTSIAEVNDDQIAPTVSSQMANKLSHLDNNCTAGVNFVMNPDINFGTSNRTLSSPEQTILCRLGYTSGNCNGSCSVIANEDGPFTLVLSQGASMTISAAQLLANDVAPITNTLGLCGSDAGISVTLANGIFTITGAQEGVFSFCYNVFGCQGWCDEANVRIIVRQSPVQLNCTLPDCNLVCFGDFEQFLPQYNSFNSQTGLPAIRASISSSNSLNSIFNQPDQNNNIVISVSNYFDPMYLSINFLDLPLSQSIQPGCDIYFEFDAVSIKNINEATPFDPTLQIYGMFNAPCNVIDLPNGNTDPFIFCNNVSGVSLTTQMANNNIFGIPIPIDDTFTTGPCGGVTDGCDIVGLQLIHFTGNFTNNQNSAISRLMFFQNTTFGIFPAGLTEMITILDNIKIYSNCNSQITLESTPNPLPICISGQPTPANIAVQLTGAGSTPVQVNVQAGPLPPGLSFAGGSFNNNGLATVTLTPNGTPQNLILQLQAGTNWVAGTTIDIPIIASAANGNFCFDPNQAGSKIQVVLTDCQGLICGCANGTNSTGIAQASSVLPNGKNGGCLAVAGTLSFNKTATISSYDLTNVEIKMQPGASLIVEAGVTVNITGGNIHGCVQMWKNIEIFGTLNLKNVDGIEDAEYAVRMRSGGVASLIGNTFKKNFISVYYEETTGASPVFSAFHSNNIHCEALNLLPSYPGQQTVVGTKSYAGVQLINLKNGVNIGNGNLANINNFHHLQNAILLENTKLTINATKYANIPINQEYAIRGFGIKATSSNLNQTGLGYGSNSTFDNVNTGIWASKSTISAISSTYRGVLTGIRVENAAYKEIRLFDNYIYADDYAIDLFANQLATKIDVSVNWIYMDAETGDNLSKGTGIAVNDLSANPTNTSKIISGNFVETNGTNIGISGNGLTQYLLNANIVSFLTQTANQGIKMTGSTECKLSCNTVNGTGTGIGTTQSPNPNGQSNCSYSIALTTGSTYQCNSSANVRTGFLFSGNCGSSANKPVDYRSNVFNSAHNRGLWMNGSANFAAIGTGNNDQSNKGNQWSGTFANKRAIHQGTAPLVQLSKFRVHTNALPWFPVGVTPVGSWFFSGETGTPSSCNPSVDCPLNGLLADEGEMIGETGRKIAQHTLGLPSIYAQGLSWEFERMLYRKISDKPTIANQATELGTFYTQNQSTPLGKLTSIDKSIYQFTTLDGNAVSVLSSNMQTIRSKLAELAAIDVSASNNPTQTQLATIAQNKKNIQLAIQNADNTLQNAVQNLQTTVNNGASQSVIVNNSIAISTICEDNRKKVNMVYLNKTMRQKPLNPIEFELIAGIAKQCPILGGVAVFEARSLLATMNDRAYFDDEILCDSASILQVAPHNSDNSILNSNADGYSFLLMPNPAYDFAQIIYEIPQDLNLQVKMNIVNMSGKLASQYNLNQSEGFVRLDLTDLTTGIYAVQYLVGDHLIFVQKLAIVR